VIRFGPYELDLVLGDLRKNGLKLRLPTQALEVLAMLVERPGEVITRQQIHARLWPNGTIVEFEHGINSSIRRLRAALSDSADQPRYIETLPRRGYRFIFPCEPFSLPKSHKPNGPTATQYRIVSKLGAGAMGVVYRALTPGSSAMSRSSSPSKGYCARRKGSKRSSAKHGQPLR
jgi:DNA-binding winged helix-turn-helix (wHTH) protein